MSYIPKKCPDCGANLDPQEPCDCHLGRMVEVFKKTRQKIQANIPEINSSIDYARAFGNRVPSNSTVKPFFIIDIKDDEPPHMTYTMHEVCDCTEVRKNLKPERLYLGVDIGKDGQTFVTVFRSKGRGKELVNVFSGWEAEWIYAKLVKYNGDIKDKIGELFGISAAIMNTIGDEQYEIYKAINNLSDIDKEGEPSK